MEDAQRTLGYQAAPLQEAAVTLSLVIPSACSWAVGVNNLPLSTTEALAARGAGSGSDCLGSNCASGSHLLVPGAQCP